MAEYDGWTIYYTRLTPSDIRDMARTADAVEGLNLEASCVAFTDLIEERLAEAFPGAAVEPDNTIAAYPPDGPNDEAVEANITHICEQLQIRDAGLWMVEQS